MKSAQSFIVCSILLVQVLQLQCFENWKRYDGYKVYNLTPTTKEQVSILHEILSTNDYLTFGHTSHIGIAAQIGIPPNDVIGFENYLKSQGFLYELYKENVQDYLDTESKRLRERYANPGHFAFDLEDFNTLDDIFEELENMATRCPAELGIICETYNIGTSFEDRDIRMLRIYKEGETKPAFWIDSGIHSGEWLPSATHLKILDLMTRNYSTDDTVTELLDKYDWYFLPIMNPDGYEFTWTDERFWRKSRNPNEGSSCNGTDLNRNFDFMWMNAGSSDDPCSHNYAGSGPASEPETQTVQSEVIRLSSNIMGLVSLHSAAYMWLHPFGHVDEEGECYYAEDDEWLLSISNSAADAVQQTFNTTIWTRGNTCETIYPASSTTMDWAKGGAAINYTCTPELREPFDPEPELIDISFQEIWNGLIAMIHALEENKRF